MQWGAATVRRSVVCCTHGLGALRAIPYTKSLDPIPGNHLTTGRRTLGLSHCVFPEEGRPSCYLPNEVETF